jgi:pSer/pThr/pTyr-binding forkhead associated (FHA) protein
MDSTVSRNHASIRNENGVFTVNDEGSSNGTEVNGTRITSQPLSPGDTLQFGSSAFRFET